MTSEEQRPSQEVGHEPASATTRYMLLGGAGVLALVALVAVGAMFGGSSSTTAADYTSNEVAEIIRLLREDAACRDTRLGNDFHEGMISLELLDAVLGQPTSKAWNGRHHVWVYRTADGTATANPNRVYEDEGADGAVPCVDMLGSVQVVGTTSNHPVDTDELRRAIVRIKSRFDDRDGIEFEQQLAARRAEERARKEAAMEARGRELDQSMEQLQVKRETTKRIARRADADFHDHVKQHFRFGTPERVAIAAQADGWIARRVETLTAAWRADEDWKAIGLPGRAAIADALQAGDPVPVVPPAPDVAAAAEATPVPRRDGDEGKPVEAAQPPVLVVHRYFDWKAYYRSLPPGVDPQSVLRDHPKWEHRHPMGYAFAEKVEGTLPLRVFRNGEGRHWYVLGENKPPAGYTEEEASLGWAYPEKQAGTRAMWLYAYRSGAGGWKAVITGVRGEHDGKVSGGAESHGVLCYLLERPTEPNTPEP